MAKEFIACIDNFPEEGTTTELRIEWPGDSVPRALYLEVPDDETGLDGLALVCGGRIAEAGDRYVFYVSDAPIVTPTQMHMRSTYSADRLTANTE